MGLLGFTGSSRDSHILPLALSVLLVTAGYYAGGVIGAVRGYPPSGIASIWLPTAILLAALLLTSPRYWWLYVLSVVPAHLHLVATFQRPEVPIVVMLCQVGSNAGMAILAALGFLLAISIPLLLLAALVEDWRRAEETLKQTQGRMGVAAASTDTGLWQYDLATARLWATDHCRTMFGLDANLPLTPQAFLGAVHPDDRAIAIAAMQAATSKVKSPRSEFRVILPSGELHWYLATSHTEFNDLGTPIRVSGIIRDVTPRRKAEQEAEQLSERVLVLQDEERQRIAQELHDSTTQHLVAISLNLTAIRARTGTDVETLELFEEINSLLDEATKELRTFTYLLNPPRLESDGLRVTLQNFVDGFGRRTGLQTTLRSNHTTDELPLPLQRSILRIVQEAFTNVHRHASASRVSVNLKRIGTRLHLVISDDGKGIEGTFGCRNGKASSLGVGITGMTARIQQFGGKLDIRSGPKGTTVHAVVPVGGV